MANWNPSPQTRFQPGKSGNPAKVWVKGQPSPNRTGISGLQAKFEEWFYREGGTEEVKQEAWTALREALKKGEAWAHNLYWPRMLPARPLDVRMNRGRDDHDNSFDFSKLSDEEF